MLDYITKKYCLSLGHNFRERHCRLFLVDSVFIILLHGISSGKHSIEKSLLHLLTIIQRERKRKYEMIAYNCLNQLTKCNA